MTPSPTGLPAPTLPADRPWWQSLARRGAVNLLVCLFIAVMMWMIVGGPKLFWPFWVYSTAIGMLSWLFIDGSRMALLRHFGVCDPRRRGWPGLRWMLLCLPGGAALGYALGTMIGDALTGHRSPALFSHAQPVIISLMMTGLATLFYYNRERVNQEQAAAEAAQRLAAETQLKLLQSQLEPHMLFNTLANLRVLIGLDSQRAQAMLDHLIAYLRATLQASRTESHALSAEFTRVDDYLALMAVRMGPRLQVQLELPDELRHLQVPPLLLQPLVENAIQHGLEPHVAGGRITVAAARQEGPEGPRLRLSVTDTGVGLAEPSPHAPGITPPTPPTGASTADPAGPTAPHAARAGTGFGTQQVRDRLAVLFGDRARFTLAPGPNGGAVATVCLPWPDAAGRPD